MKITYDKQDKFTLLTLLEENLNSIIAPNLKSEFVTLQSNGTTNLIMDLQNVKFVDSSGLSAILTAERIWKNIGSFILTGVNSENVKKLISISKLDSVLTIVPTISEAKDYIFMTELENEIKSEVDSED